MSEENLPELQAEYARLATALAMAPSAEQRAAIKADIVTLFRRTETLIADVATFKESIRELVDRFKTLPGEAAVSVRHDHIGASSYIERGWSALASADWAAAATALREAIARDATSMTARALLAWALVRTGEVDAAVTLCRPILEADPANGLARVAVGVALLQREQLDDAAVHLGHVTASASADPRAVLYAHYWLGVVALRRGEFGAAVESLRRAVTLGPNLGEGWAELGIALWHAGATADAREAWRIGAGIRHSPHGGRCRDLEALTASGGTPPRWSPT
ncbi:MAG: tetratricopeptide repeat protein [Gemmatimonadales bacterium]